MKNVSTTTGRIDAVIPQMFDGISRSYAQKLISENRVKINNRSITKPSEMAQIGDAIFVDIPELENLDITAENIPLDIIYEDDDLIVVNKPKGMVVHPANGNQTGTLVHALLHHCGKTLSGINGVSRPGIVHRIDKNTSGLLLVAKNDKAHKSLAKQIKEHTLKRQYLAIVAGRIDEAGTVNAPIGRNPKDRKKMSVHVGARLGAPATKQSSDFGIRSEKFEVRSDGKKTPNSSLLTSNCRHAITHYEPIESLQIKNKTCTLIKCTLETGRTHQIRVHMAYAGHPVVGDDVYGNKNAPQVKSRGQLLHACLLGFTHPATEKYMEFTSNPPDEFLSHCEHSEAIQRLL